MRIDLPEGESLPEVDPQADRRAEIAEAYERRREQEIKAQWEQAGLPADEPPEPPRRDEGEGEGEAATEAAQPDPRYPPVAPAAPAAPQLFPWTLPDGRQTWVTADQVVQLAQVGAGYLTQQQRPPQPPQQAYVAPQPPPPPRLDRERAALIAQRLSFGTTEEQTEALQEYAQLVQPLYDKETIKRELRQEQTLEMNLQTIGREYPEIFNDPVLTQVAALQLHNLRGNPYSAQMAELDQYRVACNQVRSRFSPVPQQSSPPQQQVEGRALSGDRLQRKRNAPSIPGGADHRMTMQEPAPRQPSASEIIKQMRTARGQAA
jgi:hypothetical protein